MRLILGAMIALRDGDFSFRLPLVWGDTDGLIASTFNQVIAMKGHFADEAKLLSQTVGKDGRLKQRMSLAGLAGGWAEQADSLNTLIDEPRFLFLLLLVAASCFATSARPRLGQARRARGRKGRLGREFASQPRAT